MKPVPLPATPHDALVARLCAALDELEQRPDFRESRDVFAYRSLRMVPGYRAAYDNGEEV